jgi:hypothetical protein
MHALPSDQAKVPAMLSSSRPHLEGIFAGLTTSAALLALVLGCSGGGTASSRRDSLSLTDNEAFGRIVGTVRIGPICPVEQFPPDPACSPTLEMFGRVRTLIWSSEGRLLRDIPLDSQGNYAVALEPGIYLVGTNDHGFGIGGQGGGLPVRVELAAGETTRVDIDIDTGIR